MSIVKVPNGTKTTGCDRSDEADVRTGGGSHLVRVITLRGTVVHEVE